MNINITDIRSNHYLQTEITTTPRTEIERSENNPTSHGFLSSIVGIRKAIHGEVSSVSSPL